MNRFFTAFFAVFVLIAIPAAGEEPQGFVRVERFFAQVDWASADAPDEIRRIRPRFAIGKGRCFGRVELDLAKTETLNGGNGNWLEIGTLVCNTSATSQVQAGRLFLSPPYSTPPPFVLRTTEYAGAIPFAAFAYGIQWHVTKGKWWIGADLTGNSGRQFDDSGNFERLEAGFRLVRTTPIGSFGLTAQGSDEFLRTGLDYNTDPKRRFGAWLGVYHNDQAPVRKLTGLAVISYRMGRLAPHLMYDWRPNGTEELTVGTEYFLTSQFRLVGDYEVEGERFLLRTQYKF